jgi:hypothetical protein
MDYKTKNLLIAVLETVSEIEKDAFSSHLTAWRIYTALTQLDPRFVSEFAKTLGNVPGFTQITNEHDISQQRISEVIQSLKQLDRLT